MEKKEIEEFYLEYNREKRNLECTKAVLDIWKQMAGTDENNNIFKLKLSKEEVLNQLELGAINQASHEWGNGTELIFDREKKTVHIKNINKQRFFIYD